MTSTQEKLEQCNQGYWMLFTITIISWVIFMVFIFYHYSKGKQDVLTVDGLKIRTSRNPEVEYPKYNPGDSVIIYQNIKYYEWFISTVDDTIPYVPPRSDGKIPVIYKKGVIQ